MGAVGGAVGGAAGAPDSAAVRVPGGTGPAVFPGSLTKSSGEREYVKEVAPVEEEPAPLAFPCPSRGSVNAAHRKPQAGSAAGTVTAVGEIKRPGPLLDEAVDASEGAGGTTGAAPRPIGSLNIWARSAGSGGGAVGCEASSAEGGRAGDSMDGAARVGGGASVAGSGGWTRWLAA